MAGPKVKLLLFASARTTLPGEPAELSIDILSGSNLAWLRKLLEEEHGRPYPDFAVCPLVTSTVETASRIDDRRVQAALAKSAFALNEEMVPQADEHCTPLKDLDVVAIIPPVSGG